MRILDVVQGSEEWRQARLGIPTSSRFGELITPKTMRPSASAARYLRELLAEYMLGEPVDAGASQWMERGTAIESEARSWYAFERGVDVYTVGLVLLDDSSCATSPDGLVGEDGLLEIKTPSAVGHVGYMMDADSLVETYRAQVQGQLWITARDWCDLLSYTPAEKGLVPVVVRVERDERYIDALRAGVAALVAKRDEYLRRFGYMR